jgi:nitrogen fixation protein FixH
MSEPQGDKRGRFWPLFIIAIFAAGIIPNLVLLFVATNDPSFAVEENYYEKSLAWDETMAQRAENERLGWSTEMSLTSAEAPRGFRRLSLSVLDAQGARLERCRVHVETFHNARAAKRIEADLETSASGVHEALLPMRRPGLWELRLTVRCGEQTFTETSMRELPGLQS